MFRNAYQRDWALVTAVCFVALALFVFTIRPSTALSMDDSIFSSAIVDEVGVMAPDCPLPTPAPACTAGDTLCSEGTNGAQCHATTYTCSGTPGTFTTPGSRCNQNACTGTPGTVGSKCQ